jgi:hypothetical protein
MFRSLYFDFDYSLPEAQPRIQIQLNSIPLEK